MLGLVPLAHALTNTRAGAPHVRDMLMAWNLISLPVLSPYLLQLWGFKGSCPATSKSFLGHQYRSPLSPTLYLPCLIIVPDSRILQGSLALPEVELCDPSLSGLKREQGVALPRLRLGHCLSHVGQHFLIPSIELSRHQCMREARGFLSMSC